jgi:hypothetical protein
MESMAVRRGETFAGARHHDTGRQGTVPNDGRVCRVRACDDSGTSPCRPCAGQERGKAAGPAADSARPRKRHPCGAEQAWTPRRAQDRSSIKRHWRPWLRRLFRATTRLMHRNKEHPHSITSSALSWIDGGTVSPSAFAVLRLTTIKYLIGIWTGSSDGLAPRRMLCT